MYRILLVDDEALIREAVSENVDWEQYGYMLAGSCENGEEALKFIEKNPVDVVLTDICMPYMDGIKLSEKIGERYPAAKVVILSGYDDFEYAKMAIRYGVKDYLLKPITAEELGKVLVGIRDELDQEKKNRQKISDLNVEYRKGQQLLYFDALLCLIKGSKTDEESCKELLKLGISFDYAVYRVAIVELDLYAKAGRLDEKTKKESELMAFTLHNISQEMVSKEHAGEVCRGKENRVYILFHTNKPLEFRQTVKEICDAIIGQMNRIMQLSVNIGIGGYVSGLENIYISCGEAEEALSYHYILGGNHVIEIESIREKKGWADVEKLVEKIILHVKKNDGCEIKNDMWEMERALRDHRYERRNAGIVLQRVVDLLDELCRISGPEDDKMPFSKEQMLERILMAEEGEQAVELLGSYCVQVGMYLEKLKNVGGRRYAVEATDYMEKNYGDPELGLNLVCSYLNISTSRFSAIFKQATGTTFMEALTGIRMQKAKELLEHTDLKNYEIAERVGFSDSHYFSVAFKKTTGKTPTEYAREMRR